jgi:Na+/H+-translocating membrane pyrophosphatase
MNLIATNKTTRTIEWGYAAVTMAALLAAMFLTWLEWAFVRSWSDERAMYVPVIVSAFGTVFLLVGVYFIRRNKRFSLQINTWASGVITTMAVLFLIEIVPIAQGNNDSGEVFWLIVLPAIGLFAHARLSYSKIRSLSISR